MFVMRCDVVFMMWHSSNTHINNNTLLWDFVTEFVPIGQIKRITRIFENMSEFEDSNSVHGIINNTTDNDGDESATSPITFVVDDMLISDEGEWISSHKPAIRFMYHALSSAMQRCKRKYEYDYLDDITFATFCSFVYRWSTGDDYKPLDSDTDSSSLSGSGDDTTTDDHSSSGDE